MGIICTCMDISEEEIRDKVKNGCHTVEEIGDETGAGTVCGACQNDIQKIIDEEIK